MTESRTISEFTQIRQRNWHADAWSFIQRVNGHRVTFLPEFKNDPVSLTFDELCVGDYMVRRSSVHAWVLLQ